MGLANLDMVLRTVRGEEEDEGEDTWPELRVDR